MIFFSEKSDFSSVKEVDFQIHILYVGPAGMITTLWVFVGFLMINPILSFFFSFLVIFLFREVKKREFAGRPFFYEKRFLNISKKNKWVKNFFIKNILVKND